MDDAAISIVDKTIDKCYECSDDVEYLSELCIISEYIDQPIISVDIYIVISDGVIIVFDSTEEGILTPNYKVTLRNYTEEMFNYILIYLKIVSYTINTYDDLVELYIPLHENYKPITKYLYKALYYIDIIKEIPDELDTMQE